MKTLFILHLSYLGKSPNRYKFYLSCSSFILSIKIFIRQYESTLHQFCSVTSNTISKWLEDPEIVSQETTPSVYGFDQVLGIDILIFYTL